MPVPAVPPELWDRITDHLHDDRPSLTAASLISRACLPASRLHRFHSLILTRESYLSFSALLFASPALGFAVRDLCLVSHSNVSRAWSDDDALDTFFAALPCVGALALVQMRMEDALYRATVQNLEGLKSLEIDACAFASYRDLVELVASFPQLRSLAAAFDKSQPQPLPLLQPPSPPKKLRALRFTGPLTGMLKALFSWLRTAEDVHIESLVYCVKSDDPLDLLQDMLEQLGPSLKYLELQVDADEALDRIFLPISFTLSPCVSLHTCTLRLALREMCVPANRSLPWVPTLLAQLAGSASTLHTITLGLTVDDIDVMDLRALDAECGVRVLRTPRFADLSALDWEEVARVLGAVPVGEGGHGGFGRLRMLRIEGRGEGRALEADVRERCPELWARKILELVEVQ
ncbi:uncharacterized protein LAESUDRAFT_764239 [Laetiporus sulphureus 93-53]|uniref:F-box domain-containing protein n=1 Tax=Laetiporus sulphureus 93-53 TaxID=1314785 RepID=A0A165BE11_9APHY|nr:uncharacterized protein LAESUDRAFT_764239 [Laetiporus sulphureus 93-53]KZT00844.1 hypothetical protein LAESUDRAFT_764239 [Laetiporus sulphureus 93-53]